MRRIHFLQHWFELSGPAAEEALHDLRAMGKFISIDLSNEPVPDETTICNFCHLMERNSLGDELFRLVNVYLAENGMKLNPGTFVDATIITTKNKEINRNPDMHQTHKGNQWYSWHEGLYWRGLIHSIAVTPANIHDSQVLEDLLHGNETRVRGDSAYAGQKDKLTKHAPKAKDFTPKKACRNRQLTGQEPSANRYKSRTRARVRACIRCNEAAVWF